MGVGKAGAALELLPSHLPKTPRGS